LSGQAQLYAISANLEAARVHAESQKEEIFEVEAERKELLARLRACQRKLLDVEAAKTYAVSAAEAKLAEANARAAVLQKKLDDLEAEKLDRLTHVGNVPGG
jgi:hypothetical protein